MGIRVASPTATRSGLGWRTSSPRSRLGLPVGRRGATCPQKARSASDGNTGRVPDGNAERVGVEDVFPALALGASCREAWRDMPSKSPERERREYGSRPRRQRGSVWLVDLFPADAADDPKKGTPAWIAPGRGSSSLRGCWPVAGRPASTGLESDVRDEDVAALLKADHDRAAAGVVVPHLAAAKERAPRSLAGTTLAAGR